MKQHIFQYPEKDNISQKTPSILCISGIPTTTHKKLDIFKDRNYNVRETSSALEIMSIAKMKGAQTKVFKSNSKFSLASAK